MNTSRNRRSFLKTTAAAGIGLTMLNTKLISANILFEDKKKIGIIGLDTSHSIAFTKEFNNPDAGPELGG